jgi:multiple antibiotic resistance protein
MDLKLLLPSIAQAAVTLFIIMDPLGGVPIFAALLRGQTPEERRRNINVGVAVAALILLLFATVGRRVLALFEVGLPELMVAGGAMLVIIGLNEVFGFLTAASGYRENLGIVPMACPLLAGPGAIVTVMLVIQRNQFPGNYVVALASIAIAMGAAWLVVRSTDGLMALLGERGAQVLAKLMGILATAIGTHFILQGLADFWRHASGSLGG